MQDTNLDESYKLPYLEDWCARRFRSIDPSIDPVKMRMLYGDIDCFNFDDNYCINYGLNCYSTYSKSKGSTYIGCTIMIPEIGNSGIRINNKWTLSSGVFLECSLDVKQIDGYTATKMYNMLTDQVNIIAGTIISGGMLLYEGKRVTVYAMNTEDIEEVSNDVGYIIIGVLGQDIEYAFYLGSDIVKYPLEILDDGYRFISRDGHERELKVKPIIRQFKVGDRTVTQDIFGIIDASRL